MKKRILTFGVFDYFHYGHLKLLQQAKGICNNCYLIVAVQQSEFIKKYKPDANIFYSTDIRCELIKSLSCVDSVITYTDVAKAIKEIDFDIFAIGADQKHQGFIDAIEYCKKNNKQIVYLQRTPNISSSIIKQSIK